MPIQQDRFFALAIGVGAPGGDFNELEGARNDALRFARWASDHGYQTTSLIDSGGSKVTLQIVRDAIAAILEHAVERLVIYFSGHGVTTAATDYWLLSDFVRYGDQAINVLLSLRDARNLPLAQVSIIADACRTSIAADQNVTGGTIFERSMIQVPRQAKVDEFLATRPGAVAQEVRGGDSSKAYGVFSKCLFDALNGAAPAAFDEQRALVSSQSLADWLADEVPMRSGMIPGGVVQYPQVDHGWGAPDDWYIARQPMRADPHLDLALPEMADFDYVSKLRHHSDFSAITDSGAKMGRRSVATRRANARSDASARVAEAAKIRDDLVDARHRRIVNAGASTSSSAIRGVSVIGAEVVRAVSRGRENRPSIERHGDRWLVRHGARPQSLGIELADGRWLGSIVMPRFDATILVDPNQVLSVSYRGPYDFDSERATQALAQWTALLTVGAAASPQQFRQFAREVRRMKHVDPTLGVLAAYAYDRGRGTGDGPLDSAADVAWYMARDNGSVPFDVAFLAGLNMRRAYAPAVLSGEERSEAPIAGSFPMMTQGWGLIAGDEPGLSPILLKLRGHLLPGLWTTFGAEAGLHFARAIIRGELP